MDAWLDLANNLERWDSAALSASDRRILMTRWVGEAWERFCSPAYDRLRWRAFEKTGLLVTADGTDDDKIMPESSTDY